MLDTPALLLTIRSTVPGGEMGAAEARRVRREMEKMRVFMFPVDDQAKVELKKN